MDDSFVTENLDCLPERTCMDRQEQLRELMREREVEGYWVVDSANVRYLTGFGGEDSSLLLTRESSFLVTDGRYEEEAREEAQADEIVLRKGAMVDAVSGLCRRFSVAGVGFAARNLSWHEGRCLASSIPEPGALPLAEGLVEKMRERKDRSEVVSILKAVRLAEEAFINFCAGIGAEQSENWHGGLLEWEMRRAGGERAAFPTICAVDEHASHPHARCSDRVVGDGGMLLVDWGVVKEGYCSDLTRILPLSKMPRTLMEAVNIVLKAQNAAMERLEPGVTLGEIDRAARSVIETAGYGEFFVHSVGHGVGLEVHEQPGVAGGNDSIALPGMVFTLEPAVYVAGEMGVRIEDMVVVTESGYVKLSSLPRHPGELQEFLSER